MFGDKRQRSRVDAVAFAGGFWAVVEQVAEMGVGIFAAQFGAGVKQKEVLLFDDIVGLQGLPETGPAGTRRVFVGR